MHQLTPELIEKVFNQFFFSKNIFYKSFLFYDDYEILIFYASNLSDIIKPKYDNFRLFQYEIETNIITLEIKLNDFLNINKL